MTTTPYLSSMVACLNKATQDGYTKNFKVTDKGLTEDENSDKAYSPEQVHIINFYRFEGTSDPADNSILYVIETSDHEKGTLIDAYGAYADEKINKFITEVEDIQKKAKA
jgi:hypothetical protein